MSTVDGLRSTIAKIQQNKRIKAVVISIVNGKAAVKISGSSQVLRGLSVTGGEVVAGQQVYVDYTTGLPVVHSYQDLSGSSKVSVLPSSRTITTDPDIQQNFQSDSPIVDGTAQENDIAVFTDNVHLIGKTKAELDLLEDAPSDDNEYLRKNGAWVEPSGGSSGSDTNAIHINESAEISGLTLKSSPSANDVLVIEDSDDSFSKKSVKISNLPTGSGGAEDPNIVTPPALSTFTWVNQNTATADELIPGTIYLYTPNNGATNINMLLKPCPSVNYQLVIRFMIRATVNNYSRCGLLLRQSSNGRLKCFEYGAMNGGARRIGTAQYNSPTSWDNNLGAKEIIGFDHTVWMRVIDNGTNRIFSFSYDAVHYEKMRTETSTDWVIPNQIGFYVNSESGYPMGLLLTSWNFVDNN